MKMQLISAWWQSIWTQRRKAEGLRLLKEQRFLLHNGMETTVEVMETLLEEHRVGSLLPARLWVKLKKPDGSFIYTYANTLLSPNHVPGRGEVLHIKYVPENLSTILVL